MLFQVAIARVKGNMVPICPTTSLEYKLQGKLHCVRLAKNNSLIMYQGKLWLEQKVRNLWKVKIIYENVVKKSSSHSGDEVQ